MSESLKMGDLLVRQSTELVVKRAGEFIAVLEAPNSSGNGELATCCQELEVATTCSEALQCTGAVLRRMMRLDSGKYTLIPDPVRYSSSSSSSAGAKEMIPVLLGVLGTVCRSKKKHAEEPLHRLANLDPTPSIVEAVVPGAEMWVIWCVLVDRTRDQGELKESLWQFVRRSLGVEGWRGAKSIQVWLDAPVRPGQELRVGDHSWDWVRRSRTVCCMEDIERGSPLVKEQP